MKRIRPSLLAPLALAAVIPAQALPDGWGSDHKAALAEAAEQVRPVLVVFGAGWCPHCRRYEETTLKDPSVTALADRFVQVALDYDQSAYLVAKYGLRGVPATLMLDPEGRRVATLGGFASPEKLTAWITRHAPEASAEMAAELGRATEAAAGAFAAALASGADEALREVLEPLFAEAVAHDDAALKLLQTQLAQTVAARPGAVVPLLLDERLLVRILVANALGLESVKGGSLEVDPWAPEPERRKAVELWKRERG